MTTMSGCGASPEVHDEEQVDLDGDVEPEELMDDEVEGDGDVEEDEETGFQDEQDASAPNGSCEKFPEDDDQRNGSVEIAPPGQASQSSEKNGNVKGRTADPLSLPPHGSEIYIGGIPRESTEDDLRDLCEPSGEIYEIRLVKAKGTGENKGFAFISFTNSDYAQKAISALNNTKFNGKTLRCSLSQAKHRLFIGNIPVDWDKEQLEKAIAEKGPGIQSIELLKDAETAGKNRGFAFIEYYNHACAENAMDNMLKSNLKLDNKVPKVRWADPKNVPESTSTATQVKTIYVGNLPDNVTQEQLKELFECHGEVTKVVLPPPKPGQTKRGYGFVHFANKESATKALEKTEKYEIEGQVLETSLAKPLPDRKSTMQGIYSAQRTGLLPNFPAPMGYGYAGDIYGSFGTGYGPMRGYTQPVIYGRGPTPAGMTMVPMMLPDGRLGYVLQQPRTAPAGPVPYRAARSGSGGRQGGGGSSGSGGSRRYRPY